MSPLTLHANTAAELMSPAPVSLVDTATVAEAAAFLTERGFGAAVVINPGGHPVGVVTKTDILVHARHHGTNPEDTTPVTSAMSPVVYTIRVEAPVRSVIEQLLELRVHHLFVIDPSGVVVGVISPVDVLKKLRWRAAVTAEGTTSGRRPARYRSRRGTSPTTPGTATRRRGGTAGPVR